MMKNIKDIVFVAILSIFVGVIIWVSEKSGRQADKISIYEAPAQLAIHDTQNPVKFPYIIGIKCEILPCGKFTGKFRECVVACNVERRRTK